MKSRFSTLEEWLKWQETLHHKTIDLGLERVSRVFRKMGAQRPAPVTVIVSGTNGKGSCVCLLEQIARHAGYKTGAYTSPHLLTYNERVRINGVPAGDAAWLEAFAAVDAARGEETLTYFEFGTLAAFHIFARHSLDFAVLEVGLGGRLDATNIIDTDAALIASIGLDHQQWLGSTREQIAREKAGIFRPERPAVCGDTEPPAALFEIARNLGTPLSCLGRDFHYSTADGCWHWAGGDVEYRELPLPRMPGPAQLRNASSVLMLLRQLASRLTVDRRAIEEGLQSSILPGRQQILARQPQVLVDVAHNAEAMAELVLRLRSEPRRTHAVFTMLSDKPVVKAVRLLGPYVDAWYLAAAGGERALAVSELAGIVAAQTSAGEPSCHASIADAFAAAHAVAEPQERILVTGSFWTVAEVMARYPGEGL
ncbi:MAG TPA: bifunctional tetrahydrofolate synthase/dihydrofolate synthase [Gammaproteobacteria bacterium]|nr:bifunctional tetrahydrofolate synthase/dihydrofolate synthase [Gammaproteobacteria bacterium]